MGRMKAINTARMLGKKPARITVEIKPAQLLHRHKVRERKILFMQGKYIRTTMQRMMRYSKKKSQPGQPPNAHKDTKRGPLLRKLIAFFVDLKAGSVIAGPMKSGNNASPTNPEVLDKGGSVPVARLLHVRKIKVGDTAPIRYLGGGRFAGVPIRTEAQAARAARLIDEENAVRAAKGSIEIKARPFTRPTFTDGGRKLRELVEAVPL